MPVEWFNIELHPEIPPQGRPIKNLIPANVVNDTYQDLNKTGEPYGIKFVPRERLSNSHIAILLGEYIHLNEPSYEDAYHEAVFRAYFTERQDIGDKEVLAAILLKLGMDPDILPKALNDPASEARMQESSQAAHSKKIAATPTFFIANERVVGAQSYSRLLAAGKRALGMTPK